MDQIKGFFAKVNKKWWIALAILVILIGGFLFWNANKKYDATKDITVSFTGYNGNGYANFDERTAREKMFDFIGKKEGLKDDDLARIKSNNMDFENMVDIYSKATKTADLVKLVDIKMSKTSGLSNGDKVTLEISVPSSDIPVKATKKTFTVKGLEKTKDASSKKIKSNLKISFKGVNGAGVLQAKSKKYKDMVLKVKKNGKLKNGDKVKVTITKSSVDAMADNGVKFTGARNFEVKVSGLIDISKVSNIADVRNLNTEYAKSENKSDDFTTSKVELMHTYITSDTEYDDTENINNEVTVNQKSEEADTYTVFGLYKITKTSDYMDKPDVTYVSYGYKGLSIDDNKLNISEKNTDDDGVTESYYDSLSIIQQNLGSHGVIAD